MTRKTQLAFATVLILILCLAFTTVTFASTGTKSEKITYRSIGIVVNGVEIAPCDEKGNSTEPFIRNADGSTYLPVRAVADALGLGVAWIADTNTVVLESGQTPKTYADPSKTSKSVTSNLTYRNIKITLDGKFISLTNAQGGTVEPFIMGGSTYIPVRAVAEALGCTVDWDANKNMITLSKRGLPAPVVDNSVKTVGISKASMNMMPGSTEKLSASVLPANAKDAQIYWTSSNESVATVDGKGYVTANREGFAYITAYTANGKSASCGVTVKDDTVVTITRTALSLAPGGTYKLSADSKPAGQQIYWTSSKPEIATVDESGNVTAKAEGLTYITAYTAGGKSISCEVTVKDTTVVTISRTAISMTVGTGYKLNADSKPAGQQIYWTSSKPDIATVDAYGNVYAKKNGFTYITAYTASGKSISCGVTVNLPSIPKLTFSSGAGGWQTVLTINKDGTFKGEYYDYDYYDCYYCIFNGKFTVDSVVDSSTILLKLTQLNIPAASNKYYSKYEYGRYITYQPSEPYGIDGGTYFYLYLPTKDTRYLDEDCTDWLNSWFYAGSPRTLNEYALYCKQNGCAFESGYGVK